MTRYTDDALARAIYRLADARMQAVGTHLPCSEDVFSVLTAAAPDAVLYPAIAELSNEDFLQVAFLLLLERPIDAGACAAWEERLSLPREEFQTEVLNSVLGSAEYQRRMIPLCGCPLPISTSMPQVQHIVVNTGLPPRLVKLYQKLPPFLQRLAKKIVGKEA